MSENSAVQDSIKTDTIALPAEQLEDILRTKADSQRTDVANDMQYLIRNAQVKYMDMEVNADYIAINRKTNRIFARGKTDSTGRILEPVVAIQGGKKYETDQFDYNFKTRQAIAYNARTEESEGVIVAEKTKKYSDSVFYMRRGIYTTDDYFIKKKDSVADYYLRAPNIKLVKGKNSSQVITGPIQMYVEQVPTPLVMPFAILPFSEKRSAGILIPSFGEREEVGFYLNGLGYYQPIGDHFDLKILADIYTKGSWNLRPEMNYIKKYRYNGNFSADIGTTVRGIKGLSSYSKSGTYRIAWRHSQDYKANPFLTFSASVDIVSNKFYNNTINNNYIFNQNVFNTQQNSAVTLTKRFLNLPITITGTASYSQNFATGLSDLRLPQMTVAVNQFYLLPSKTGVRTGLLENITINTGLNFNNYVETAASNLFKKEMWQEMQTGATNKILLGTNASFAKYFTFSVSADINNAATTKRLKRSYDPISNAMVDEMQNKVSAYSMFSTSASVQTTLYGTKLFNNDRWLRGIRHMVLPSISFTYAPDFGSENFGYFRNYYAADGTLTPYSIFDRGIVGTPTSGMVGAMGFSIGNNLEMKVRSKTDSTGVKKVKIFESLNISGQYNFAAKDHRWSAFSINGQTSLLENKLQINTSLIVDPYEVVFTPGMDTGYRSENFGKFNIQGFNMTLSYPLSSAIFKSKDQKPPEQTYRTRGAVRNENYYFDEDNYAHFTQDWTLNINANYGYSKALTRFGKSVAAIGLDGQLKLTPYWNISGNAYYDVVTNQLDYVRLGFSRDQRSFTINFNWVPFGQYKVYDFFIGIKANILKDALKYKERSFTQPNANF